MIETITEEQLTPQQAEFWVRARQAVDKIGRAHV